jgi:hypothetical protein
MSIGIKISVDRTRYGGFSAEAQTYKTNVIANGGTVSDSVLAILDTNLFKPLVASGDWARLDKFHLYAGVGSAIAARTNMVSSSYYINPVNSPTWNNSTGYTGNGSTSYLDLNYNPSLGSTLLTQNSATVFYGAKVTAYDFTRSFGARNAGVKNLAIFRLSTPASDAIANDNLDLLNTNVVTNSIALFGLQRTASIGTNCKASIINTNFSYGNQISIGIPNVTLFQCARNSSGTAESFDEMKQYYMGAGNGSVNTNTILTAINNTLAALGIS